MPTRFPSPTHARVALQPPAPRAATAPSGSRASATAAAAKTERPPWNPHSGNRHEDAWRGFPEHVPDPLPGGAVDRLRASGKLGKTGEAGAGEGGGKEKEEAKPSFKPTSVPGGRYVSSVATHPLNLHTFTVTVRSPRAVVARG